MLIAQWYSGRHASSFWSLSWVRVPSKDKDQEEDAWRWLYHWAINACFEKIYNITIILVFFLIKKWTCLDSSMVQQAALWCSCCSSSVRIPAEEEQPEHRNVGCCTIELSRHVFFFNLFFNWIITNIWNMFLLY